MFDSCEEKGRIRRDDVKFSEVCLASWMNFVAYFSITAVWKRVMRNMSSEVLTLTYVVLRIRRERLKNNWLKVSHSMSASTRGRCSVAARYLGALAHETIYFLQESKPVLAVKGILAPKVAHQTPAVSKSTSPTTTTARNSQSADESYRSERLSSDVSCGQQPQIAAAVTTSNAPVKGNSTSTLATSKTTVGIVPSQSPTVGVVSPMMSHRVVKVPQTPNHITGSLSYFTSLIEEEN